MQYLTTEKKDDYIIITMDRGRANPLNLDMVNEFRSLVEDIAYDPGIRGAIITGKEHFFSVGVDVLELYEKDELVVKTFWKAFVNLIQDLVSFPKPLVAAVTGHSPAGGAVLAICCDHRVMSQGSYSIGLNELFVGITLPKLIFNLYAFWIGNRNAYQNLMEAKMLSPEEALSQGLVDEICDPSDVILKAEEQLKKYLSYGSIAWQHSKQNIREQLIDDITHQDFEVAFNTTMEDWFTEETQERMQMTISMLKK